ncbi:uncharacterized protein LOC125768541 [Anopheles funestus]|uniref:uncharacterized protein LOC125768541 n=1 Tax=Anopheles funestus TaxID=62324 RepID=UPI0020C60475|nr:uncharacterized protein LOC125768541 [Anopheles funestus]
MVVYICDHIGSLIKTELTNNYKSRGKSDISVSCEDCRKNFVGKAYDAVKTVGDVEKNCEEENPHKQISWLKTIRAMDERVKDQSPGVKKVFEIIKLIDNIPRKKQQFVRFFLNSSSECSTQDIETAWSLTEQEFEEQKKISNETNERNQEKTADIPAKNGTTGAVKIVETEASLEQEDAPVKQKKIKTKQSAENDAAPLAKMQKMSKNVQKTKPKRKNP